MAETVAAAVAVGTVVAAEIVAAAVAVGIAVAEPVEVEVAEEEGELLEL